LQEGKRKSEEKRNGVITKEKEKSEAKEKLK